MGLCFNFRKIDIPGMKSGIHWQTCLYDPSAGAMGELPYPVAIAWLTDFTDTPLACMMMDFILVPDHFRRRGYATALIKACRTRWPNLELTEAISESGEELLRSLPQY
jgi:hypothetical protein